MNASNSRFQPRFPTRRTLLRGAGVVMALPWMESLLASRWPCAPRRELLSAPRRVAVLFSGNGFHSREWWARGAGSALEFGRVLSPLQDLRERLLVINGLYNAEAQKGNIHSSQTGNLLSGAPLASGGEIRSGLSFDQLVAQRNAGSTPLPSLVIGCEKSNPSVHKNYSMLYSSHISWSGPTTPTPLEIYPALAFRSLFNDGGERGDRHVLDAVLADARGLRPRLGATDRQKLDEYLESVRDLEQRIEAATAQPRTPPSDTQAPAPGLPEHLDEHMRLMCDILILAFQSDTTRVATLKLNNDHSSQRFPHLGVDAIIHHLLSHSDTEDWLRVNQFFVEQLAYIGRRLAQIQEGEHSLLHNCMLLYLSSMRTGNHDATNLPVLLLGDAGGTIQGGRVLDYSGSADRQLCRLYLSIMSKLDVPLERFGDATRPLEEI